MASLLALEPEKDTISDDAAKFHYNPHTHNDFPLNRLLDRGPMQGPYE